MSNAWTLVKPLKPKSGVCNPYLPIEIAELIDEYVPESNWSRFAHKIIQLKRNMKRIKIPRSVRKEYEPNRYNLLGMRVYVTSLLIQAIRTRAWTRLSMNLSIFRIVQP